MKMERMEGWDERKGVAERSSRWQSLVEGEQVKKEIEKSQREAEKVQGISD